MKRQTWILQQRSLYYGEQTLWVADDVFRMEHKDLGIAHFLHKRPKWAVVGLNMREQTFFEAEFEEFLNGRVVDNSSDPPLVKVKSTELAGVNATEYSQTFHPYNSKHSYWFANEITLPPNSSFFYFYGVFGVPKDATLLRHVSSGNIEFDTTACEEKEQSLDDLIAVPSDFRRVKSAEDVVGDSFIPGVRASGPHPHRP